MQIAPLSATFSITTWRAIKCNVDTGSETFSPSYLSPCRIAINFISMRYCHRAFLYRIRNRFECEKLRSRVSHRVRVESISNVGWYFESRDMHPILTLFIAKIFHDSVTCIPDYVELRPFRKWLYWTRNTFPHVAHRITLADNFPWIREDRSESLCPVC